MSTFSVTQTGLSNYGPNNNGYSIGNRKESAQDFLAATQKEEEEKELQSKSASIGDTLYFESLTLRAEPSDVSNYALWYTPCADLNFIQSSYTEGSCESYGTEQLLSATNIAITSDASNAGEIIRLIAQSKADPRARDTLIVYINE